jgi:hypothetical protein
MAQENPLSLLSKVSDHVNIKLLTAELKEITSIITFSSTL